MIPPPVPRPKAGFHQTIVIFAMFVTDHEMAPPMAEPGQLVG